MFVDVDGVVNVFGDPEHYHDGTNADLVNKYPLYNTDTCYKADAMNRVHPLHRSYDLLWSHEMIHDMKTIIESPSVDFSWLTSWYPFTDEIINPLFDMSYEDNPDVIIDTVSGWMHFHQDYYDKYNYVKKYILQHPHNPVIWVDDEYVNSYSYHDMENALESCHTPRSVLMIQTNSIIGISRKQMDIIRDFCAKPTEGIRFITEANDYQNSGNHIGY
jgi:hypothetical protein